MTPYGVNTLIIPSEIGKSQVGILLMV